MDLVEDREDMDILITSEQLLSLTYFAPHECMAVVCLVEYSIGPPELRNSRYDSESTVRASIQRSHDITEVTLGVAMYVPCDGYNLLLKNTVDSADDGVDIEIKLTNDMDICSILSPKPVVRTKDGEVTVVKTKTDLNVSQDLSKSTKLKGETTMLLGFDLRAIHPSQGELMHKSDLTDIKQSATLDENYDEKNEHEEKTAKFESSRRSEDMETINFGRRSNGGSFKVTGSKISMKDKPEFDLDDNQSVLSIVTGDSDGSALRIDPLYYTSQHPKTILADTHVEYVGLTHPKSKPSLIPNNKSSLLAMSMQTKLGVKKMNENEDDVLKENRIYADRGKLQQASKTPFISAASNQMHNRELSRGMRSRLNRHGFNEAILDSDFSRISRMLPKTNGSANYHVVDIQDEASDELSLHEISIQFAGIRQNAVNGRISGIEKVKRIYCSYQFYSCNPTRTEIMRLLPSNNASTSLLARDEAYAQDEAPLALRYMVDCSLSPTEAFEFTEYLAHQTLYIEVWDSDSTILLGISGVPLRKLLRHKESFQKNTIECDIINPYLQDQRLQDLSCTISMAGPILGVVVGALQVIVSNYGHPGSQPLRENKSIDQDIDLNWRTSNDLKQDKTRNRPKNSVRAKPLSESSPELSKALSDIRYSAVKASSSMRSIAGIRGLESANTLTYDEVSVLFRRFQGSLKGTVQYVGDMMKLLDVPSYNLAIRKLIRCYALFNDLPGFKKVRDYTIRYRR